MEKFDYLQIKNFSSSKASLTEVERQATSWKKWFATHISDKRLVLSLCEKLLQINQRMTNNSVEKWAKEIK